LSGTIEKLSLSRGDFSGQNDGPIAVTYTAGRLEVDLLKFKGANTELTLSGSAGPAQLDVKINGTVDFRLLESFIPTLERSAGRLDLSAAVAGTLKDPAILGSAEFRDTRLSLRSQPLTARNLSGRVEFSEARVLIQDVHGILNDGRVSFHGNVNLKRFALASLELALQLDEVSFRPKEDLPTTLLGELTLSGKPNAMVLAGDLDIVKFRYDRPLVLQTLFTQIQSAQSTYFPEAAAEWLTFDVGLHAKGDVRIDNNVARARLVGDLRLTGTNSHPGLIGVLQAADGSQAFYRGNQFTVTQGMLEFKERKSIEAVFDLHAETQVRVYLVRLHAFGRLADPKVILNSEPELSEGDIVSLLTLGVTSRDRSNTAGTSAGLAAEALFTTSGLDRQVQRFLPKNPVLRDFALHISTSYNDYKDIVEPTWQFESKFLTEQLKLRFTEPFSGRGRKAQAEYRFDNRVSAQAQWDNEYSNYAFGNLGLNLKLHWEVD
jgi:translocation and assembly module TamB